MELREKEWYINRIIVGKLLFEFAGKKYFIRTPSKENRYLADEIYRDVLQDSLSENCMDEEEYEKFLSKNGLWHPQNDTQLSLLSKEIEDVKVSIYRGVCAAQNTDSLRKKIDSLKERVEGLSQKKHSYEHMTADGAAVMQKARFLAAMSIFNLDGTPLFLAENYWTVDAKISEAAMQFLSLNRITEEIYREIARTDPWRIYWNTKSGSGNVVFSGPTVDWTDEQRVLIYWTQFYDNINEHHEKPSDNVVDDDLALDGWIIVKKREKLKGSDAEFVNSKINSDKIRNSNEVFVIVNKEDAQRVYNSNDDMTRARAKAKMQRVNREGKVEVTNTPEAMEAKQQAAIQAIRSKS